MGVEGWGGGRRVVGGGHSTNDNGGGNSLNPRYGVSLLSAVVSLEIYNQGKWEYDQKMPNLQKYDALKTRI